MRLCGNGARGRRHWDPAKGNLRSLDAAAQITWQSNPGGGPHEEAVALTETAAAADGTEREYRTSAGCWPRCSWRRTEQHLRKAPLPRVLRLSPLPAAVLGPSAPGPLRTRGAHAARGRGGTTAASRTPPHRGPRRIAAPGRWQDQPWRGRARNPLRRHAACRRFRFVLLARRSQTLKTPPLRQRTSPLPSDGRQRRIDSTDGAALFELVSYPG